MKRHHGLYVITALALAALLAGCWGSDKSTSLELTQTGNIVAAAAAVGIDKCHNCHADSAVESVGIFTAWAASRHANLDNSFDAYDNSLGATNYHGLRPGYEADEAATCGVCHDPNGDSANIGKYVGPGSGTTVRNVVGCEACHGGGEQHFGVGPIGGPSTGFYAVAATTGQSSQYNTCTKCHQETSPEHTEAYRAITDTHFENTVKTAKAVILGYIIRKNQATACTDCHNPHSAGLTENRQWKASGHADFAADAWWDEATRYVGNALAYDRCQRCHSTTGFVKYGTNHLDNLVTADFTADGYVVDNEAQVLYCWGCHNKAGSTGFTSARRTVQDARVPGAWDNGQVVYSATNSLNSYTIVTGKGDSELCMNCHSSRPYRNGFFVTPYILAKTTRGVSIDNIAYGGPTPHYLVAVQTLFQDNTRGIGGYALPNKDYTNNSDFAHDTIGGSTSGPCVGCHMSSPSVAGNDNTGKHSFLPFIYDDHEARTSITAIASTKCAECHGGTAPALTAGSLNASKALHAARLAEFRAALEAEGIYPNANGNGFYTTSGLTTTITDWQTRAVAINASLTGYDLFGICNNFNLLNYEAAEPGAWAHNSVYAGRLIYDALDVLTGAPSTTNFPDGRPGDPL